MNLYKISQTVNNGYAAYDCAVVVAPDAEYAKIMIPATIGTPNPNPDDTWHSVDWDWTTPDNVLVEYIGTASVEYTEAQVIVASFHAG